jgi:transcriptional regulator of acetoin/glycerol metabolism
MHDHDRLLAASRNPDPEVGLAGVAALRDLVEELELFHVEAARRQGWSWQRIARSLGVSRQAVHQKYALRKLVGRRR